MENDNINEIVSRYVSVLEADYSEKMRKIYEHNDMDIHINFTVFGNRVAIKAIHDLINLLDDDNRSKVVEMMKNIKL